MKIAYIARPYRYSNLLKKGLREEHEVDEFKCYEELKYPKNYDILFVESIGRDSMLASQVKHKCLIILATGVDLYEGSLHRLDWDNIDCLLTYSKHQAEYFKRRWGATCSPGKVAILPVPAPLDEFSLKKNKRANNKVALIANITDRKGTYQIPEFLQRFPDLEIHHLGKVCLYGNPVREFVRWRLGKDGNTKRYHWQKHEGPHRMNKWFEDKTYLWMPTISEGFCRAILEGMTKGLKPIVRRFAGSEEIWMKESLYDRMEEIDKIVRSSYEPKKYREYVIENYHAAKIIIKLKKIIYDLRL